MHRPLRPHLRSDDGGRGAARGGPRAARARGGGALARVRGGRGRRRAARAPAAAAARAHRPAGRARRARGSPHLYADCQGGPSKGYLSYSDVYSLCVD